MLFRVPSLSSASDSSSSSDADSSDEELGGWSKPSSLLLFPSSHKKIVNHLGLIMSSFRTIPCLFLPKYAPNWLSSMPGGRMGGGGTCSSWHNRPLCQGKQVYRYVILTK